MKPMSDQQQAVLNAFTHFWKTWSEREKGADTITDLIPLFHPDVSAIGSGEHEAGWTFDQVIQNFTDDFNEMRTGFSLRFLNVNAKTISDTSAFVEAEANVEIESDGEDLILFHMRISQIFVCESDRWLAIHIHCSFPSTDQDLGEAYPIDALKAKNNKLKKLVLQRTEELSQRTRQVQEQKDRAEQLLYNILPKKIAHELLDTGKNIPLRHENVSVLFTDFKEFTEIASQISATKLVEELNEIFYKFDDITLDLGIEKIKTIGDSYMAVCGVPDPVDNHAMRCIEAARLMMGFIEQRNNLAPLYWKMRIGIHSGPVVAGVVGNHKFSYDLWGNTVNVASRLESLSEAGRINISQQTFDKVKSKYSCTYRGKLEAKGKGAIDMYFVN